MTTPNIDTKALRERKQQPIERIRDAFARAHKIATGGLAHYMSIPADAERDADLILSDAIDELEALRNAAPALLALAERAQEQAKEIEGLRVQVDALVAESQSETLARVEYATLAGKRGEKILDLALERDALKAEVERLQIEKQNLVNVVAKLSASEREAERLRAALKSLRMQHAECPDPWYSCRPSSLGGCTCGADSKNAIIDAALRGEEAPRE